MSDADARYIIQAATELDLKFEPSYSGRGMMGRSCIGVYLDRFQQVGEMMFNLGMINQTDEVDDMTALVHNWRYDSMGKSGWILYWPLIEMPEKTCPKCAAETMIQRWAAGECSAGVETAQEHCPECEWKGEPH